MLSRVADSLYWMSRYLERAEHTVRLIDVNMSLMLDEASTTANLSLERRWKRVLACLGHPAHIEWSGDFYQLTHDLTFSTRSHAAIVNSIAQARENARQVRDELSSEQWQQLNRLYHSMTAAQREVSSYNALTSFEPVCYLVDQPLLLVVNSTSPYHTLADLLDAARAKPGDLTLAANGPATAYHIAFETLRRAAKVDMTFVPYPGTAPAVTAVMGDHVTSYLGSYAAVMEQLGGGKLRALATPSKARIESLPDVPTVSESGITDYEAVNWIGVLAPAKTPKETVSQLASWFAAAMDAPEVKAKLVVQGLLPATKCGAGFAAVLKKEYEAYGRAVHDANIRAE